MYAPSSHGVFFCLPRRQAGLPAGQAGSEPAMSPASERQVLNKEDIARALTRIAHEILERNHGTANLCLIGIRTRGVFLADRLQKQIQQIEQKPITTGILDITLYRDDLGEIGGRPQIRETKLPGDITGKTVILIDDVLYTGRTIRAALDALVDFGRPHAIQLAVLVDRGHRELPIKADYIGKNIPTSRQEEVIVHLAETDTQEEVLVKEKKAL